MRLAWILVVMLMVSPIGQAWARTTDNELCALAIARNEAAGALPAGLLTAVAASELGRYDRNRRAVAPWPWTVNNAGDGRYFASKAEAIAHVRRLKEAGERNIDVGCMQINLMHHPDAFTSLDEAFEPTRNVAYGARFLSALERETSSWARAVERYHTADPGRGRAYREKVYQRWAQAPVDVPLGVDDAPMPTLMQASLAPDAPVRGHVGERRTLKPLAGRGFISLGNGAQRVAMLRPSTDRQLKPIVRPPRRTSVGLVRLTSARRTVLAMGP